MSEQAVMEPPKKEKTAQEKNAEINKRNANAEKQMEIMRRNADAAKISSVKYKQETVTIAYGLIENNADNTITLVSKDEPHAAFIDAMNALAPHVAEIIFHASGEKTYQVNNIDVKGVNFDMKGDEFFAGITSTLRLDNGKTTTLNTPPLPLSHPDPNVARHTEEAAKAIETVLRETRAFLGGRRAQGNLFAKLD